ncbi:hypothetical protein ACET3X_007235 [Alternaria dauci]|uniref:Carrier domain-containing protein n=1 Tax=Alternaria dauci TaxID=48095 RepID=A0ABR3UDB1_9PLEO
MALLRASEGALASVVVSLRGDILVAHGTLSSRGLDESRNGNQSDMGQKILDRVRLPQAFIPAILCILDTMPKTPNGKLDRKSIAALPLDNAKRDTNGGLEDVEKMTVREGELRLLWERVLPTLGDLRLGPSSDFFMCGGNSMLLMKLQKAIKETTGIHVSTKELYESSTLRAMTHCVLDRANRADNDANKLRYST